MLTRRSIALQGQSAIDTTHSRRSPTRKRNSPRSPVRKSPARKSPARKSPARKSPARKSPARKSPARKPPAKLLIRKSPVRSSSDIYQSEITATEKREPVKRNLAIRIEKMHENNFVTESYRVTRSKRTNSLDQQYSISDVTSTNEISSGYQVNGDDSNRLSLSESYGMRERRTLQEPYSESNQESVSRSASKSVSQSIDTYSDENSEEELKSELVTTKPVIRNLSTPLRDSINKYVQIRHRWEFGGRIGSVLLMIIMPLTAFSILNLCAKDCSIASFSNLDTVKSLLVFKWQLLFAIFGQYILQGFFAVVPVFGTTADRMDETHKEHCFNAFFSCIFTITLLFTLDYFKIFDSNSLLGEYLTLAIISYTLAVFLAITLFIKGRKVRQLNLYANTGYTLYDFWMGRELHPFIKMLDVKIWISRISNITALILTVLIFKKGIHIQTKGIENITLDNYQKLIEHVQLNPTILLYSMMQIIYLLYFIMREYKMTSSFFWASEGVGYYQIVYSALYPFYFTTVSKFIADAKISLQTNSLIFSSLLYMLGFLILLVSNNIKYEFRKNPLQPSLAHVDSMPTFHGKKLLIANLWRYLRHPNYLGDIMVHISLALPGILTGFWIASAPPLLHIVVLLHRAVRDNARCNRRYGAAWQRYCARVPSVIIPKLL